MLQEPVARGREPVLRVVQGEGLGGQDQQDTGEEEQVEGMPHSVRAAGCYLSERFGDVEMIKFCCAWSRNCEAKWRGFASIFIKYPVD